MADENGAGSGAADAGAGDKGAADKGAGDAAAAAAAASAAASAGDKSAADATILDKGAGDKGVGDKAVADKAVVEATWPDDWRAKLAGKDEALLKRLSRFSSPENVWKSYAALEQRMKTGELKSALPENATDDQVAGWRKDNGIPEKPEGYLEKLPDGIVIGEDDKKLVTDFATAMHKVNAPPAVVAQAIDWHYKFEEAIKADQNEADKAFKQEHDDALRAEWGAEFRANVNTVKTFLEKAPKGLGENLLGARLANGQMLGNDGEALRWLLNVAKEIDPAATVVPAAGAQAGKAIEGEISAFKAKMGDRQSDYWKGPTAKANQQRYRELVDARDKMKARATA